MNMLINPSYSYRFHWDVVNLCLCVGSMIDSFDDLTLFLRDQTNTVLWPLAQGYGTLITRSKGFVGRVPLGFTQHVYLSRSWHKMMS